MHGASRLKPTPDPAPATSEFFPSGLALPLAPWAHAAHKPVFIVFLVFFAVKWATLVFLIDWPWTEGLFWALAALAALVGLARRLPEQNVFAAAALITGIAFVITIIGDKTAVPFGPRIYTSNLGETMFGVPWPLPLIWLAVIVAGRGVARLIMRPWRKTTYYGFWVIGLTCLLSLVLDLGFEPFAAQTKRYWLWQTHIEILAWNSVPWVNYLGWVVTSVAILGFTTPWLINKQPVKQPIDYHPLALWLLLNVYLTTGNAIHQLWSVVIFSVAANTAAAIYAVRGARW